MRGWTEQLVGKRWGNRHRPVKKSFQEVQTISQLNKKGSDILN